MSRCSIYNLKSFKCFSLSVVKCFNPIRNEARLFSFFPCLKVFKMGDFQMITGGCYCGAVRYQAEATIEAAIQLGFKFR